MLITNQLVPYSRATFPSILYRFGAVAAVIFIDGLFGVRGLRSDVGPRTGVDLQIELSPATRTPRHPRHTAGTVTKILQKLEIATRLGKFS